MNSKVSKIKQITFVIIILTATFVANMKSGEIKLNLKRKLSLSWKLNGCCTSVKLINDTGLLFSFSSRADNE